MGVLQDSLRPRWCLWARGYWGDARNHHRYGAVARGRRTLPMLAGAACKKKKIITSIDVTDKIERPSIFIGGR